MARYIQLDKNHIVREDRIIAVHKGSVIRHAEDGTKETVPYVYVEYGDGEDQSVGIEEEQITHFLQWFEKKHTIIVIGE